MHFTPWQFVKADDLTFSHNRVIIYDSEFVREKTYYPQLALAQINQTDWSKAALVDTLHDDCRSLWKRLAHHSAPIVMHAAAQDIEMIQSVSGYTLKSLRDTQIGFSLFNPNPAISYADMVKYFLNIEMDKSETRSDWLSRPLSDTQCAYAADDVGPLLACYWYLTEKLSQLNRLHWWQEDSMRFLREQSQIKPDFSWYKLRNATQKLRKKHIPLAQLLVDHREMLAKQANLPRRKIVSDEAIIHAALLELKTLDDLYDYFAKEMHFLSEIENIENDLINIDQLDIPQRPRAEPLTNNQQKKLDQLIVFTQTQADLLNIAPETLASPRELRSWVSKDFQNINKFNGWRSEIFKEFAQ